MRFFLLLFFATFKSAFASPSFYVVGEDYLLFSDSKGETQLETGLSLGSWALDSSQCQLWAVSKENNQLFVFERGKKNEVIPFQGKIISEFSGGLFATVSPQGSIEFRNQKGLVVHQFLFEETRYLKQMNLLFSGETWSLLQKETGEMWLQKSDLSGKGIKKVPLKPTDEFWGNARLFVDEAKDKMWVGYSSRSPHHAYAPVIEELSVLGEKKGFYQWDERGFFFDGCVDSHGDFILARDLPTSPYTVPDYFFLEKIGSSQNQGQKVEKLLELETNRLVDSMACHSQGLYMATHSIFGSEPKLVLFWSGNPDETIQESVKLPSRALKILLCTEN